MPTTKMIQHHLQLIDSNDSLLIAYTINNHANNYPWKDIQVLLNGNKTDKQIPLNAGTWSVAVDGKPVNEKGLQQLTSTVSVPATTAYVLYKVSKEISSLVSMWQDYIFFFGTNQYSAIKLGLLPAPTHMPKSCGHNFLFFLFAL